MAALPVLRRLHQGADDFAAAVVADLDQPRAFLAVVVGAPVEVMAGNHLAAGDAAAALGGAFPGGKPAEEALGLGLGNQAIAAGAALPRRLGVQHVQPAAIALVLGADRRSEARRVGKACDSMGRTRWATT